MAKHPGMHKVEKRKKELARQKKQEEKRKKRLLKGTNKEDGSEAGEEAPHTEGMQEAQL